MFALVVFKIDNKTAAVPDEWLTVEEVGTSYLNHYITDLVLYLILLFHK